ncbi:sodium channel protein type 7 subunit alpha [Dipodomys merriami]|uniref:sodium channel protein type 7 subunit alpha n=1 Tax=Dipodomys merriami TaxID=94247 RepID=UPI00384FD279
MLVSPKPKGLVPFTRESLDLIKQRMAKKHHDDHEEEELEPNPDLEVGKKLPFTYGNLSQGMMSVPLEDVDPYYYVKRNTFIVLNKKRTIFRFNASSILCTLSPFNVIRGTSVKVLVHPFFQLLILISVLTDGMIMTLSSPPKWVLTIENSLLGIYTFEILIKIIARGVWAGPFSFLGDLWNWLDFSVTSFELMTRYSFPNHTPLFKTIRSLRILKVIPLNQGLNSLVGTLIHGLKKLIGAISLTLLFLSIFSLFGMGLFMGNLKHKCVHWPQENETQHNRTGNPYYIRETEHFYYMEGDRYALLCGNRTDAGQCPEGYVCVKEGINPDRGYTNFDNFGWAFFALFRLMTQDYPEALYHQILYASGKVYMMFFVVVSFWFAFYMASLFLGILIMIYEKEKQTEAEKVKITQLTFQQTVELQEENDASETKAIQIEMKKKFATSENTSVDILEDATLRHTKDHKKSKKRCPLYCHKFAKSFLIWNCSPCWLKLRDFFHKIIMSPFSDLFLIVCIILNICFLAWEHFPMSESTFSLLSIGNMVFLGIFTAEMIFKIIAMHPYEYFQAGWNIFDSIVVFLGVFELYLANIAGIDLLRSFRTFRILKLGKYWPTFEILRLNLSKSLTALKGLVLLLLLFVFFFAVFGMKLFSWSYTNYVCLIDIDCHLPRWHMADFFHSYLNVFRVLCGEWIETLWDCMAVSRPSWCIPFYMMVILIGNLLVLYLFVALVSSFSSCKDVTTRESNEIKNIQQATEKMKKGMSNVLSKMLCKKQNVPKETIDRASDTYFKENISDHTLSELSYTQDFLKDKDKSNGTEKTPLTENESQSLRPSFSTSETVPIASGESDIENLDNKEIRSMSGNRDSKEKIKQSSSSECSTVDIAISEEEEIIYGHEKPRHLKSGYRRGSSIGQISKQSRRGKIWQNIRKTCCKIVENIWFKGFIGLVTLLSTGALAFEDIYIDQRKTIKILLEYADMIFTYIFILEMLLKWIAYGFKAYFSNSWYKLDFMVVLVFCLSLIGKTREDLKPLTSIKFLRGLRVLSQFERMKVVVRALIKTTLPTLNVFLVCLLIWLVFSVMGVNLFAGTFYACFDPTSGEKFTIFEVMNKSQCESLVFNETMLWENAKLNFDNVGNGFLSLFQIATFNGWIDIMNSAVDSTTVNGQPFFENNLYLYLYFLHFIIFGLFLPLSMLIGAIVSNFNKHRIKQGGTNIFITAKQKKQYRALKRLMYEDSETSVPRPKNKFQGCIFDFVTSRVFKVISMVLICLQALTLMLQSDEQSLQMDVFFTWTDLVFVILYSVECILKLISFHCYYFTIVWNIFDFVVVVFSITGLLVPVTIGYYLVPPSLVQLILLSRIAHILRRGKGPKVFHDLMLPFVLSLPALLNIGLLIFLVMFIYAIFGMYNFAYVKKEAGINDVSNFETFGSSMLCLFQVTILAGWDGMLQAIFNSEWSDCDPDKINPGTQVKGDCGNPSVGIFYFVSYILIAWLIIVNMYIVVIMEFVTITSKKKARTLSEDDFRKFFQVWKRFDPDRTQYIDSSKLSDFAAALDPPLFMAKPNKGQLVALDLPMAVGDRIHCLDILLALTKRVMGKDERMEKVLSEIESGFMSANPFKITYEPITTTLKRKQEAVSATIIQRAYKSYRLRQGDKNTSDIQIVDDDRDAQAAKEDAHTEKAKEKSCNQSQT